MVCPKVEVGTGPLLRTLGCEWWAVTPPTLTSGGPGGTATSILPWWCGEQGLLAAGWALLGRVVAAAGYLQAVLCAWPQAPWCHCCSCCHCSPHSLPSGDTECGISTELLLEVSRWCQACAACSTKQQ